MMELLLRVQYIYGPLQVKYWGSGTPVALTSMQESMSDMRVNLYKFECVLSGVSYITLLLFSLGPIEAHQLSGLHLILCCFTSHIMRVFCSN